MPVLSISAGKVTGVWGTAFIKHKDGRLVAIKVGDHVDDGEQILTSQDGIVRISPDKGTPFVVKAPAPDADAVIAAVERGDDDAVTAAGLAGTAAGGLLPGLRVDRVVETVGQQSFEFGTERVPAGIPLGLSSAVQPASPAPAAALPPEPASRQLSINSVAVNEGAGVAVFRITLDSPSTQPVTVSYGTANGTATGLGQADFSPTSGKVTFLPGETSKLISVPITNDNVYEGRETFTVTLSDPVNAGISQGVGTGTIADDGTGDGGTKDDDRPAVQSISSPTTAEGGNLDFKLVLSHPSTTPTQLDVKLTAGSTNPADLGKDIGVVKVSFDGGKTFAPITIDPVTGQATIVVPANTPADQVVVRVPTQSDNLTEPTESVQLSASTLINTAPVVATGLITDATGQPTLKLSGPVDVNEAAGELTYTVTLSNPSSTDVTVQYSTANGVASSTVGSATAGQDYNAQTGTITILAGQTTATIKVPVLNDGTYEGSEAFQVNLSNAKGAAIATGSVTTTIHDDGTGSLPNAGPNGGTPDDDRPAVQSISSPTTAEGGNLDFKLTLSHPSTTDTSITLKLAPGATDPATLGTDAQPKDTATPQVSFDGGKTFAPITIDPVTGQATIVVPANTPADQVVVRVPTQSDNLTEPTESVQLSASTPINTAPVVATGSILDATGQPTLKISGPVDVNEAAGELTYTVTLSNPSSTDVTVQYSTANGSATAGQDYTAQSGTVTILAGQTTATIKVPVLNDGTYEGPEAFQVNLSNPNGAVITTGSVTTTIHDDGTGSLPNAGPNGGTPDDDRPAVQSISSPTTAEGGNLDFKLTLSHPSTTDTPITLKLAPGATDPATLGTDAQPKDTATPQVSFDGGKTFAPITVDPVTGQATIVVPANTPADQVVVRVPTQSDNLTEPTESVQLSASTPINTAPVVATGSILDATGQPTLKISGPVDVNEAAGELTYTVTLSNPSSTDVTVQYSTANGVASSTVGSATAGQDYTAQSGTITILAGQTTATIKVPVLNDGTYEGSEAFQVNLSNAKGAAIATGSVTTTIHDDGTGSLPNAGLNGGTPDDDRPAVQSISSPTTAEGGNLDFKLTLSHPSTTDTPITLKLAPGATDPATLGTDAQPKDTATPQVSFDGGKTFAPITVDPVTGQATIVVPANTPADQVVVRVPTQSDNLTEPTESVQLSASTPINTAPVVATGSILDATGQPTLKISGPVDVNEAAGELTYTVTLSNPSSTDVTVQYSTANGVASSTVGSATAGQDYTAQSGTITILAGQTTATIKVPVLNDGTYEGSEAFQVNLSNAKGAAIATGSVTTTIHDDGTGSLPNAGPNGGTPDDDRPAVQSISSPTTAEGGNLDFKLTLSHPSTTDTPITLKLAPGATDPATLGTDAQPKDTATPQVSFDGGKTFAPITIDPVTGQATIVVPANTPADQVVVRVPTQSDNLTEPTESVQLSASTPINTAPVVATGSILDATGQPTLKISGPVDVNEAAGELTYTVTLSNPSSTDVTVQYSTANGSATAGQDYTAQSGTVTILAGQTTATIKVPVLNDGTYEGPEAFQVNLSNPNGAVITTGSVTTTIHDDGTGSLPNAGPNGGTPDDDRPAVQSISSPTTAEGGNLDFKLTLSHPSTTDTPITLKLAPGATDPATLGTDAQPKDTATPQVSFDGGKTFAPITVDPVTGQATIVVPANTPADQVVVRVPTQSDNLTEPTESVQLSASTPINTAPVVATGSILDATGQPTLKISGPVDVNEAAGELTYTVTLSNPSSTDVTVQYSTANGVASSTVGSATAGQDYTAQSGTITILAGQTTATIKVPVLNDGTYEGSEAFQVNLSNAKGAAIATGSVTTTIHDDGTGSLPNAGLNGGTPDDDRPAVQSISSPTTAEGGNLDFKLTLSHPSTTDTPITLKLAPGATDPATLGTDAQPKDTATPQVSFDGGKTFAPITVDPVTGQATIVVPANTPADQVVVRVPTQSDNLTEPTESVQLSASTPINTAPVVATGSILDATGQPTLKISGPVDVNEAAGELTYTVTLSNPSSTDVTVQYSTANGVASSTVGSATAGQDYTAQSGTITILAGQTTATIKVPVLNDGTYEGSEAFQVNLSNAKGAAIATGSVTTTIHDDGTGSLPNAGPNGGTPDDDRPAVQSISSPTTAEGGNLDFKLTLSHPSTTDTPITLKLAPGATDPATLGTDAQPKDTATPQVSFDGGKTFAPITIDPVTGQATIVVPANTPADQVVVRVPTQSDNLTEPTESVQLSASTPINTAPVVATGLITDATGQPTLKISGPVDVNEAAGELTYTVTLSNPSSTDVTVQYSTANGVASSTVGSATAGQDYTAQSGTITILAGQTTATIKVPVLNDGTYEGSEAFQVNLSNAKGAAIATGSVTTTIHDDGTGSLPNAGPNGGTPDDDRPAVQSISSPTTAEGGNLDFKLTLSHPSTTDTPITLKLAPGATDPATLGTDAQPKDTATPQVSFDGGKTFAPITIDPVTGQATIVVPANTPADQIVVRVPTQSDNLTEPTESVQLSASTLINTAPVVATGSILDATGQPTLKISGPVDVNEAAGELTYTVTLSNPSSTDVTVQYSTANGVASSTVGSATAGQDYTAQSGTVTILAGQTTATIKVPVLNDGTYEGFEAFQVKLSNPTGAVITTGSVTTTIHDDGTGSLPNGLPTDPKDDDRPVLTVTDGQAIEGQPVVFTVTLSQPSAAPQTLALSLKPGSAQAVSDYPGTIELSYDGGNKWDPVEAGRVQVPANVTSVLVRVPTVNDTVTETSETFTLQVSSPVAANGPVSAIGTIVDNDAAPVLDLDGNDSSGKSGAGYATSYLENAAPVRISDVDIKITDVDSTQLTGATIKLTNAQPGDALSVLEGLPGGITATIVNGVVTLSGLASLADYQTAIRAIGFANSTDTPAAGDRLIEVVVTDGNSNSNTAVTTITVTPVNDAPVVGSATASVSEEGLSGGIKDNTGTPDTTDSTSFSGRVAISDVDSSALSVSLGAPTTPVFATNGTQLTWVSDGQGGLIGKAGTAADAPSVVSVTINNAGEYTVNLLGSIKHTAQGEDVQAINFEVRVSDGANVSKGLLTVNVEDDAPTAPAVQQSTVSVLDTNLMVVLDVSGSMADPSGINGLTRLQAAVQSITKLIDQYDTFGTLAVRLVTFSGTAQTLGDAWLTAANAKALLGSIVASGGTNYDYALSTAQAAFDTSAGKLAGGAQNVSYFFSDGNPTLSSTNPNPGGAQNGATTQPTLGDGIDATEEAAWIQFLNSRDINSFAVGLGTGVEQTYLNPVAYNGQFSVDQDGVVVTNLSQLDSTLSGTLRGSTTGKIYTTGNVSNTELGADGGHLESVTVGSQTFLYDAANPSLTVTTVAGAKFTLNWLTGAYTYAAADGTRDGAQDTIGYTLVDGDGDVVSSTLVLNIVHNAPDFGGASVTSTEATVSEEGLAGGIKDATGVSDTTDATSATGQITATSPGGAAIKAYTIEAPTATLVTASGKTVVWTSDNAGGLIGKDGADANANTVLTLTVNKTGGYTAVLSQAVQHSGAGEDVLDLTFGVRVLDANNKVGAGSLVVHIEDDAPTAAPISAALSTSLDTNLMVVLDVSGSMADASGINGLTRLQAAIQSIETLIDNYDAGGSVAVRLVTFSDAAKSLGSGWLSASDAKALLGSIVATGGTNYDYALTEAQAAFATTTGKLGSAQNVSYFLSDGNPTLSSANPKPGVNGQSVATTQTNLGDGIDTTEEGKWITFLTDNQIKSYAFGLGTGVTNTYLDPVAYDGQAAENLRGTVTTTFAQLDAALAVTSEPALTGSLVSSGGLSAPMGADGFAHVASITVDGIRTDYDPSNTTVHFTTKMGGDLTVDMSTGAYTYGAPGQFSGQLTDTIGFALADKDGDTASSSLNITLDHTQVVNGSASADTIAASQRAVLVTAGDGADKVTGSDAADRLFGNGGNDTLSGAGGNDYLHGGDGNDTLDGGSGIDTLVGGAGSDVMTGGAGADVFAWHFADAGANSAARAVDTIKDFSVAEGDKLDLRDLLQGETAANLGNYLLIDTTTANTFIKVSPTGGFGGLFGLGNNAAETERIVLENVNIRTAVGLASNASDAQVLAKLISQGQLLVDNG